MGDTTLFLETGFSGVNVKLHPVVLFTILDHFVRRTEGQERVIGTLLGSNVDGVVEIRNCFPVPHTEGDQVAVDMDFHRNMYALHLKANPKETIVGWYATGSEITEHSVFIQNDFYWQEMGLSHASPIHVIVDTNLTGGTMDIKAFTSSNVAFAGAKLGAQFQPAKLELDYVEAERIGVDVLSRAKAEGSTASNVLSDIGNLEVEVSKLSKIIDTIAEYVDKVVKGEITADNNVGRFLMSSLGMLQKLDVAAFEKMFNNSLQDLLMVTYLSNLTRAQLALAERLQGNI